MVALLWADGASIVYAPWWGVTLLMMSWLACLFVALERTVGRSIDPVKAAYVPFWGLGFLIVVTTLGVTFGDWR